MKKEMKVDIENLLTKNTCPCCKLSGGVIMGISIDSSSDYSFMTTTCKCRNIDCKAEFKVFYKPYDIWEV